MEQDLLQEANCISLDGPQRALQVGHRVGALPGVRQRGDIRHQHVSLRVRILRFHQRQLVARLAISSGRRCRHCTVLRAGCPRSPAMHMPTVSELPITCLYALEGLGCLAATPGSLAHSDTLPPEDIRGRKYRRALGKKDLDWRVMPVDVIST